MRVRLLFWRWRWVIWCVRWNTERGMSSITLSYKNKCRSLWHTFWEDDERDAEDTGQTGEREAGKGRERETGERRVRERRERDERATGERRVRERRERDERERRVRDG